MHANIAIIGAGPSGLVLARILELNKIPYLVFERDADANALRQGGSLDIHPKSGQLALEACGLIDAFKTAARYDAQEVRAKDSQGNILLHEKYDLQTQRPEIDRAQLRDILLRSIPQEKIRWNAAVSKVERGSNGRMSVHFGEAEVASGFDLVVGADGAWSKVRKLVTDAIPEYSGFYYLQSDIKPVNANFDRLTATVGPGSLLYIGSAKQIAAQRLADGTINTYICLQLPKAWSKTDQQHRSDPTVFRRKLLDDQFSDWADEAKDFIRHSDGPLYAWPLYFIPTEHLCWKTVPGVALIGDAAHVSTPFVGEGVNCSMYDGLQLAQAIVKHGVGGLDQAVAEYEKEMFPRAIDLIKRSTGSQEVILGEDAVNAFKQKLASAAAA